MTSLYSNEIMFKSKSEAKGVSERKNDSSQPVHSCPCSQITGVNTFVSAASTTFATILGPRPKIPVKVTQVFKKLLRLISLR